MADGTYSFIDIAVLDPVRMWFAQGGALAVVSRDLDRLIWANGAGARLFGRIDVESAMGCPSGLSIPARRQIGALHAFPDIGLDRPVSIRIGGHVTALLASAVTLPDGQAAILLRMGGSADAASDPVAGFVEAGYTAALIGETGAILNATDGFADLGIEARTLLDLVEEVRDEADRLVKRRVDSAAGPLPVGFARLADDPARHLLVTAAPARVAADGPHETGAEASVEVARGSDETPSAERADDETPDGAKSRHQEPAHREDLTHREGSAHREGPVRFVWRTDAEGRFTAVSPEFVEAVGARAADVIGRDFADVATVFGFDLDHEIADLLARRDTWSGRTVLWPLEGRALRVPVDLAALPVYHRDRTFEGFRGFGVARMNDVVNDEEGIGLALAAGWQPDAGAQGPAAPSTGTADAGDPFAGEKPALEFDARPTRRAGDKVVQLDERRAEPGRRTLSPVERHAFQEIGARLRRQSEAGRSEADEGGTNEQPASAGPQETEAEAGRRRQERARFEERIEAELASAVTRPEGGERRDHLPPNVVRLAGAKTEPADLAAATDSDAETPAADEPSPSSGSTPAPPETTFPIDMLAVLPLAVLVHAGDRLHAASDAFLDLTGYGSLAEIGDAGGLEALFPDDADTSGEPPFEGTLLLRTAAQQVVAVHAHLQSVPWASGKALMLTLSPVAAGSTPTVEPTDADPERAALEARLAEMRAIIDTATDGVVLIAADRTIRSLSRPAEALFGTDSASLEGRPFETLFAIESQRAARDYLERLSQDNVASLLNDGREVIGKEAQGRFIPLFMTVGRLPDAGGYCAVLRDLTQWKRAEEELLQSRAQAEHASSQKSDFLARISHEIRTPLNAIIGFSELIINESFGPIGTERYRDYLRDISKSGNHVLDLVNDLLDISKIEAGEQEMNYEAVLINDTLAEAVAMMQPQANRERVIIRSSFASRLPEVVADLRSLRQIALNLLSNAVRYTPAGGQVIVSTAYETSGDIIVRVRDTGIGMSAAEIEQALKPFKRVNTLKRSQREGTGLGLPLTKAMVEANRARFSIASTPGEGTLVEIVFPAARVLAS